MNRFENNQVTIKGLIVSNFRYSHELYGEKFYLIDVKVQRISGSYDVLPVMISNRLFDIAQNCTGYRVKITGQLRSYNKGGEFKRKLLLSIFAMDAVILDEIDNSKDENEIMLEGYICKEPIYRKTPLGREIADLLLAINRPYGKSDYIPCICWGRNARYASSLRVSDRCEFHGRVQSREYIKKLADGSEEVRVAYEVSISKMEVLLDEE